MVIYKKISLLLGILIYILMALLLKIILLPLTLSGYFRIISCWTRIFSRFLRFFLKIRVNIAGDLSRLKERANFIVSNHLGYLDGIILGSLFAIIYTSKSEVMRWPLFGWMSEAGETIFIDRKRKFKSADYIQEVTEMLKRKVNVLVFAEGTSTDGGQLRPFQTIHFQPPLNAKSWILPVTISYTKINAEEVNLKNRDKVCWYGQINFYQHLLEVLKLNSIEAKVVIHPKIDSAGFLNAGRSRKDLSEALHEIIARNYPLFK